MIQVICCSSLLSVPGWAGAFSRDFTTSLAPECRAFSGALKIEKLKAPLIPMTGALAEYHEKIFRNEYGRALVHEIIDRPMYIAYPGRW